MSKDGQKQQTQTTDTSTESTPTWQGSLEDWQDWAEENLDVWIDAMVEE